MRTYSECMPCFLRQATDAAALMGEDEALSMEIRDEVSRALAGIPRHITPPEMARTVYGIAEDMTGGKDAYARIKKKSNHMALELYPRMKALVEASYECLAGCLAVAGNVIDYGVPHAFDIEQEIDDCLEKEFAVFDFEAFSDSVERADNILTYSITRER